MWSFFLGEADPLCPQALMAIHRAYSNDGSGPLVMATGGGKGGGDPAAFVVVAAPRVVVSALSLSSLPTIHLCSHTLPNASRLIFADCCVGTLAGYVVQKGPRSRRHPKI
jgi:hypothetical protein